MYTYEVDLDVTPGVVPQVIHVKQYQTGAILKFNLYSRIGDLTIGTVSECTIRGTKNDGNGYSVNATCNTSGEYVTTRLTEQMTAISGKQPFELTITDTSGKLITATFYLDVERSAMDMNTLSNSVIRELTNALDHTDEILEAYNNSNILASEFYTNFSSYNSGLVGYVPSKTLGSLTVTSKWLYIGGLQTSNISALKTHQSSLYRYRIYGYTSVTSVTTSNSSALQAAYDRYIGDFLFDGQIRILDPSWKMIVVGVARTDDANVTSSDMTAVKQLIDAYSTIYQRMDTELDKNESDLAKLQRSMFPVFYTNFESLSSHYVGYVIDRSSGVFRSGYPKWMIIGTINTSNFNALVMNESDTYRYRIYGYNKNISLGSGDAALTEAYAGCIDTTDFNGQFEVLDPTWKKIAIGISRQDGANVTESDFEARTLIDAYAYHSDAKTEDSGSYGVTVRKNNTTFVNEFLAIAETYRNHTGMTYGQSTIFDRSTSTNSIDCSTFVGLCLRGYTFSRTPYATGRYVSPDTWTANPNYVWTINPFDYENALDAGGETTSKVRTASQIAEWMVKRGLMVPMDKHLANLEPGDILFWARKNSSTNSWVDPNRYMRINHIAICKSKEPAPTDDPNWDVTKYPYKHELIEAGTDVDNSPIRVRVVEDGQDDPTNIYYNNINTLVLICRPDLGQPFSPVDVLSYATGTSRTYAGVTYTFNSDGSCTVFGEATDLSFTIYYSSSNSLPSWIEPGKKYKVVYNSENVSLQIYPYVNGDLGSMILNTKKDATVTIPSNVTGLIVRLSVSNGVTVDETVHPYMYTTEYEDEFIDDTTYLAYVGQKLEDISDCDDITFASMFFKSSNNTLTNYPFGVGWLQTFKAYTGKSTFQLAYPYGASSTPKYRVRNVDGLWGNWVSLASGGGSQGGDIEYNNTYNITVNPSITTDSHGWLAAVDDSSTAQEDATDMTASIMAMLTSTGYCHLGPGYYYVSGNIDMPNGSMLIGCGNDTHVILLDEDPNDNPIVNGYIVQPGQSCTIKDIAFYGGNSAPASLYTENVSDLGSRHGIYIVGSSKTRNVLDSCTFQYFNGSAIYMADNGGLVTGYLKASNVSVSNSMVGINIDQSSEYNKFTNVVINTCNHACINNGGNNVFTNCTFHGVVGFVIDNSSLQKENIAHGTCSACTFNHINNHNNSSQLGMGDAVVIKNAVNGFIFTGCQLWYGEINIQSSRGISFTDCLIGGNTPSISVTGSYPAFFANCIFHQTPALNVTSNTKFDNCYLDSNGNAVTV